VLSLHNGRLIQRAPSNIVSMKLTLACNVNVADVVLAVVLILSSIVPIFGCLMRTNKKYVYFLSSFLVTFFFCFLSGYKGKVAYYG
jgi:uncharacterized membrane protein